MTETLTQSIARIQFEIAAHMAHALDGFQQAADELDDTDMFPESDLLCAFRRIAPENPQYVIILCSVATLPDAAVAAVHHLEMVVAKQKQLIHARELFANGNKRRSLYLVKQVKYG